MEWKYKPIIVVDESRLNLILHLVGLAVELRAVVADFDQFAVLIGSFKGNFASLWLPLPFVCGFKQSGDVYAPCVTNRFDLVIRIEAVGFGDLFDNRVSLLRRGKRRENQRH